MAFHLPQGYDQFTFAVSVERKLLVEAAAQMERRLLALKTGGPQLDATEQLALLMLRKATGQ